MALSDECTEKVCSKCGLSKPVDEFPVMSRGKCGRYAYCRPCHAEYQRARHPKRDDLDERRLEKASLKQLGMKRCTRCGEIKPLDEGFYGDPRRSDGKQSQCKACQHSDTKRRAAYYLRQYGITVEEYEAMFEAQDGRCAVCRRPPGSKRLVVDHDHSTHLVRGLVCGWCNTQVLPLFERYPENMRRASAYLASPPAFQVIGVREVPETNQSRKRSRKRRAA